MRFREMMGVLCTLVAITSPADELASNRSTASPDKQTVVMILVDGARWDLPDTDAMPNLNGLIKRGVRAEMVPVGPTISSPNHWAIATGLYPIHSGVYDNSMYDTANGRLFVPQGSDRAGEPGEGWDLWMRGEPIWAAVARLGGVSGVIANWVGAQPQNSTRRPSFFIPYLQDDYDSCEHCGRLLVDLVDLLDQDSSKRPRLLCLWVSQIDRYEHESGVGSPRAKRASARVDQIVGDLMSGLASRRLSDRVNVIIVSDHGQITVSDESRHFFLDDLIDLTDLIVTPPFGRMPLLELWPKPGHEEKVYGRLRATGPHLHVYRAGEFPVGWHCCDREHGPPMMVVADPGWTVGIHGSAGSNDVGYHGYDNASREMHSLFIAAGPAFRRGVLLQPFDNVDVHSLAAYLLDVESTNTDGLLAPLCAALKEGPASCKDRR